jgi:hypothetical protein
LLLRNGKKVDAFYEKRKYYASKFLQRQEQVRRWLEDVVHTELPQKSTQLAQRLGDGEILCSLVNEIRPNSIPKIVRKPEGAEKSYKSMENILAFLRVCREVFKFPEADLFEPIDLFEQKNWIKVIYCLQALASFAKKANPKVKLPPPVEVKEAILDVPLNLSNEESLSRTAEQQIEAMAAQFDEDEVERFASQADQLRAAEEHLQELRVPTPPNSQPSSPHVPQVIDVESNDNRVEEPVIEVRPQLRSVGIKPRTSSNTPVLLLLGLALWYWLWSLNNARGQLHVL